MPLQRVMAETTAGEFAEWQAYLDEEDVRRTKQDYYLAQIAQTAAGGRLGDYLLDFDQRERRDPTDAEAKAWFAAWLGGRA